MAIRKILFLCEEFKQCTNTFESYSSIPVRSIQIRACKSKLPFGEHIHIQLNGKSVTGIKYHYAQYNKEREAEIVHLATHCLKWLTMRDVISALEREAIDSSRSNPEAISMEDLLEMIREPLTRLLRKGGLSDECIKENLKSYNSFCDFINSQDRQAFGPLFSLGVTVVFDGSIVLRDRPWQSKERQLKELVDVFRKQSH